MTRLARIWGYRPDGSACVFAVPVGGGVPAGWSEDVTVIKDAALRKGQKLSEAAGRSVFEPVPVSEDVQEELEIEALVEDQKAEQSLRYDENNLPVDGPVKRGPGRPRKNA